MTTVQPELRGGFYFPSSSPSAPSHSRTESGLSRPPFSQVSSTSSTSTAALLAARPPMQTDRHLSPHTPPKHVIKSDDSISPLQLERQGSTSITNRMDALLDIHRVLYKSRGDAGSPTEGSALEKRPQELRRIMDQYLESDCGKSAAWGRTY